MPNRLISLSYILTAFIAVALLASCAKGPAPENRPELTHFFSLKDYFAQEVQALSSVNKVKKTTAVNGEKEEHILEAIDFERELKAFSEADINRQAWTDKYSIDSLFNDEKVLTKLAYTAIDPKLKTKRVEIDFEDSVVSKIFIENSTSSAVAKTRQLLTFQPGTGYSFQSTQNVILTSDDTFFVEVRFL
jgi:hypothetical protein